MVAVYKGSLTLDKVTGVRKDNGKKFIEAPLKPSTDLPPTTKARKTSANVTRDGLKK